MARSASSSRSGPSPSGPSRSGTSRSASGARSDAHRAQGSAWDSDGEPGRSPTKARGKGKKVRRARHPLARLARFVVALSVAVPVTYLGVCFLLLGAYRFVLPPTTGVQMQRRAAALTGGRALSYTKHYAPLRLSQVSAHVPHAVVAAEDGRFYQHFGFDLKAMQAAREQAERRGRPMRGASTLTQQLVKNLFATTHRSVLRKGMEVPLTFMAEALLPKERILELYVNVVEWGPGVYGVEAAAQHHYGTPAARLTRSQSARLAALLPNPLGRTTQNSAWYGRMIERRMAQMGW